MAKAIGLALFIAMIIDVIVLVILNAIPVYRGLGERFHVMISSLLGLANMFISMIIVIWINHAKR